MRLSRKMLYAVEAVVDVAYNARPDPVQSKDITARQGIPQRYLEQVMQQLVKAGILKGVRGPKGGYRLARERRRITVGEIVRVVGAIDAADEVPEADGSDLSCAVVRPLWQELEVSMMERLDAITVEDLCRRAREQGVLSASERSTDFTI
ncbi:MAG: RrF2 family transcriptional regulator [Alphaproteobacteria bacterium]